MEETKNTGVFLANLTKNFKQIKQERAESVTEDVETTFRRHIEDLCKDIRDIDRTLQNLFLSMAPTTALENTVVPADFNASAFMKKEQELGLERRKLLITLRIMLERYEYYFGEYANVDAVRKVDSTWKHGATAQEVEG